MALLRDEAALEPILAAKADRMREVAHAARRGRLIIGLSGGIDSAVALGIAVRAVGAGDVTAVRLPSRHTEQVHLDDAAATAAAVGLPDDEPAHRLDRADPGGPRRGAARRGRLGHSGSGTPARGAG